MTSLGFSVDYNDNSCPHGTLVDQYCFDCADETTPPAPPTAAVPVPRRPRRARKPQAPSDISGDIPSRSPAAGLPAVEARYRHWFGPDYDLGVLRAVLATAAIGQLDGDPAWLLVVGGPGATKTETIAPLAGAGAIVTSSVSGEAALLSGTSKKEVAADANGGLLRRIGNEGLLVIKDVTTILSMQRDSRAAVLAALREVYDGRWSREVGSDGGRTLTWAGRLVVVGAVTTAWDSAHAVISTMGDRFVLTRMDSTSSGSRRAAGLQALDNVGREVEMRDDLARHVGELLAELDPGAGGQLDREEQLQLLAVADLVTLTRTAVERDYQGNVVMAHAPEMPTRFAKQLAQITRGGLALGLDRAEALAVALRCGADSMPPLRLTVLAAVAGRAESTTAEVTKLVQLPRQTVDRCLQELHLLGLLEVEDRDRGRGVQWVYHLHPDVDRDVLDALAKSNQKCQEGRKGGRPT